MPQIVPVLFGGGAVLSGVTNFVIGALGIAAKAGLSYYQQAKAKKAARRQQSPGQSLQHNIRQGIIQRWMVLGLANIGGAVIFWEARDGAFYIATILSDDVIDGISAFYVNDTEVLLDANGYVTTPPFNARDGRLVQFELRNGWTNQAPSGLLQYGFPGTITNADIGAGIAYLVARVVQPVMAEDAQAIFNSQVPSIGALVRGALVYDPRDATQNPAVQNSWKHSTNPALILLHYFTAKNGFGLSRSLFDGDLFSKLADHCDEMVMTKAGTLRKRYELGGFYSYDEEPAAIAQKILDTCAGQIFITSNGLIGVSCDGLDAAEFTITQDMITSIKVERRIGVLFESTTIRSRYSSEAHRYIELVEEAQPWDDPATKARVGRGIPFDFNLPFVFRHDQARRLMKRKWYQLNPEWVIEGTIDYNGIELYDQRICHVVHDVFGIDHDFRIEAIAPDHEHGFARNKFRFTSIDKRASEWDPETEEGTAPPVAPATSDSVVPQAPTGLFVRIGDTSGGLGTGVRGVAAWTANTTGHSQEAQFKLSSDTSWTDCSVGPGDRAFALPLTGALTDGENYDFRVRVVNARYGASAWASVTFTASYVAGSTSALQNFVAVTGPLRIVTSVTQANAVTAGFTETLVLATGAAHPGVGAWTGSVFKAATQNQTINNDITVAAAGQYDLYARSVGVNGDRGAVSGPLVVTVPAVTTSTGSGSTGSSGGGSNNNGGGNNDGGSGTNTSAAGHQYGSDYGTGYGGSIGGNGGGGSSGGGLY